jgi:predicted N-acyltransferase
MAAVKNDSNDYVTRVLESPLELPAAEWNALLAEQQAPTPFMRHEYLAALHESRSATAATGWTPRFFGLWRGGELQGGCAVYLKDHSYGEYVFDWAWANAYEQHGLSYYPKAVAAVPFTPVPGSRLLARDADARRALVEAVLGWCRKHEQSSFHMLFSAPDDVAACEAAGLMLRHTVQFHWTQPAAEGWKSFEDFLSGLAQEKRKKIRQERRKVAEAGVTFRWRRGADIGEKDWNFFYRCYERTYYEHGNAPYLTRDFFRRMAAAMPENWLLFVAERSGKAIACSLIAIDSLPPAAQAGGAGKPRPAAYGRYWGALERVDCLHFEACYYQPLQWCIENGYDRFEGGAQGEHKMARALMPVKTTSCHWLAHPSFADAVERFLVKEGRGIENYLEHLDERSPFRRVGA